MSFSFGGGGGGAPGSVLPQGFEQRLSDDGRHLELWQMAGTGDAIADTMIASQSADGTFLATSVTTGVSSFHLGGVHAFGSAGENVVFINEHTGVNWWPMWQGYDPATETIYPPTSRRLGPHTVADGGAKHATTATRYSTTIAPTDNTMFTAITVETAEDIFAVDVIWTARYTGDDKTISRKKMRPNRFANEEFKIVFDYPLFVQAGQSVDVEIRRADTGELMFCAAQAANSSEPWRAVEFHTFEDLSLFVKGMIIDWYGTAADVPAGWQICDGTNGTPDLRGVFVRGATDDAQVNDALTGYTTARPATAFTTDSAGDHQHEAGSDFTGMATSANAVGTAGSEVPVFTSTVMSYPMGMASLLADSTQAYSSGNNNVDGSRLPHWHNVTFSGKLASAGSHSHTITGGGDSETAPNHKYLYKIMYVG